MEHKEIIKKGSKSFSLASLFFSQKEKEASWKLYSWCRYCDDAIDEETDPLLMKERLESLRSETQKLVHGPSAQIHFSGMHEVMRDFKLPMIYPQDLLRGMEMDVLGRRYETLEDLEEYCYCVAGTVGLMMCHILGIRSEKALKHAVSMGNAMQLTNIARDIGEDHQRGRLYLPTSWLKELGIGESELFNELNQDKLITLQERLLARADVLYREGYEGLSYLSLRSSWAVMIASLIYREIGQSIRKNPLRSLSERTIVSTGRKISLIVLSSVKMIPLIFLSLTQGRVSSPKSIWSRGL